MAREKQGYRDALERIRHEAAGEMVTVAEAAHMLVLWDYREAIPAARDLLDEYEALVMDTDEG